MLLDQKTLAVVLAAVLLLQGIGWLLIWRNQPHTPGVKISFISSLLFVPGLLLLSLRGEVSVWLSDVLANYLGVGGLVLTLFAVADMADRPRPWRIGVGLYAINLVAWPLYALLVPGHVGWIGAIGAVLGMGIALACAREAWGAQQAPKVIRGLIAALNLFHAAFSAFRFIDGLEEILTGSSLVPAGIRSVFYLEFILYAAFFFIGIVALLGSRLAYALVQQNEMLLREADQRRQLQAELAAALAEESAARREQRHFLDMVSHEFRTPLAIMDRAAEMIGITLSAKPEAAPQLGEVAAMRNEGQRLRLMIDAFLAQERLQSGLGEPRRESFDLADQLDEWHVGLDEQQAARIDLDLPQHCLVQGDPDLTRIAIASLVDAALHGAGPQAVPLKLVLHQSVTAAGETTAELILEGNAPATDGESLSEITARRLLEAQGGELLSGTAAGPGRLAVLRLPCRVPEQTG